ncbi:MAG: radical SAM/Cys-rich domain protein [Gammaproteobacteria bacterium]|nr:radical SAM/Cys-rich domain protein [Gammaproteobacteria bacterium]
MLATLPLLQQRHFPAIKRGKLNILQVNMGYRCNQSCLHCHVNAGPKRTEEMSAETLDTVVEFIRKQSITTLDLTGGAPELHPGFRDLVSKVSALGVRIIDRCNLTILEEPGQEELASFLAQHRVEVAASLPCYLSENVENQRGAGVFKKSILGLQQLNQQGYGLKDTGLQLNLVFNPQGPVLPPSQEGLEADYHRILQQDHAVSFNQLFTITNMPIKRFGSSLISKGQFDDYMELLQQAYQPENLDGVMCRSLISVDWQGYVYDCDFNQMLDLPLNIHHHNQPRLSDLINVDLESSDIVVADHCYGCTAGQGSSCGGALS